jgi:hypothetical protein
MKIVSPERNTFVDFKGQDSVSCTKATMATLSPKFGCVNLKFCSVFNDVNVHGELNEYTIKVRDKARRRQ